MTDYCFLTKVFYIWKSLAALADVTRATSSAGIFFSCAINDAIKGI